MYWVVRLSIISHLAVTMEEWKIIAIFKIKASSCRNETIQHSQIAKHGRKQSEWHLVEHRLSVL